MKLNQVIAIEKGIKAKANEDVSALYKMIQKPALFEGFSKTYKPNTEGGDTFPAEKKLVEAKSDAVLDQVEAAKSTYLDVEATKDWGNTKAFADVVVDGMVVLEKAPATFLLTLEKELTDIHTFLLKLPELDPAEEWQVDENAGVYKTQPLETIKTKKVAKPIVLYDATKEHPAQCQLINEDITVGTWNMIRMSGAIRSNEKKALIEKVELLRDAVKIAREEANTITVEDKKIAKKIFDYLFEM